MLELPKIDLHQRCLTAPMYDDVPMWKFWCLEEGTLGVDPNMHKTNDGSMPRRSFMWIADAPLYSDVDGSLITDKLWGHLLQARLQLRRHPGRRLPLQVVDQKIPTRSPIDPYGPDSPDFIVGDDFIHMWCSMLAHCQKRFQRSRYRLLQKQRGFRRPRLLHAGQLSRSSIVFRENVYVIADSQPRLQNDRSR